MTTQDVSLLQAYRAREEPFFPALPMIDDRVTTQLSGAHSSFNEAEQDKPRGFCSVTTTGTPRIAAASIYVQLPACISLLPSALPIQTKTAMLWTWQLRKTSLTIFSAVATTLPYSYITLLNRSWMSQTKKAVCSNSIGVSIDWVSDSYAYLSGNNFHHSMYHC